MKSLWYTIRIWIMDALCPTDCRVVHVPAVERKCDEIVTWCSHVSPVAPLVANELRLFVTGEQRNAEDRYYGVVELRERIRRANMGPDWEPINISAIMGGKDADS